MLWDLLKVVLGSKNILKVLFYYFLYLRSDFEKAELQRVVVETLNIGMLVLEKQYLVTLPR